MTPVAGPRPAARLAVTLAVVSLAAAQPACGGDGDRDGPAAKGGPAAPEAGSPKPRPGEDGPGGVAAPGEAPGAGAGAERRPGGAGDEEPIRSEVVVTGRGGRLRPTHVRVPPFIAVRLELRSADGGRYGLAVAGRTLTAGPGAPTAAVMLDGLSPNGRYDARATAGRGGVAIVASSEPGP